MRNKMLLAVFVPFLITYFPGLSYSLTCPSAQAVNSVVSLSQVAHTGNYAISIKSQELNGDWESGIVTPKSNVIVKNFLAAGLPTRANHQQPLCVYNLSDGNPLMLFLVSNDYLVFIKDPNASTGTWNSTGSQCFSPDNKASDCVFNIDPSIDPSHR